MKENRIRSKDFTDQEMQSIVDKLSTVVLFPEKVAKANETLKKVGVPKFETTQPISTVR